MSAWELRNRPPPSSFFFLIQESGLAYVAYELKQLLSYFKHRKPSLLL